MFKPVNRYLLVKQIKDGEKQESLIVLPEDYKPEEERFILVEVMAVPNDIRFNVVKGDKLIVDRSMVEEIKIEGTNYNVILDNYVIGII